MRLKQWRRWLIMLGCVVLIGSSGMHGAHLQAMAAPLPAGLTTADWQAIAAQLPHAPAATIEQHAYAKASNTDAGDYFGSSVAMSGNTVVVGAFGESSNAIGVNGDQTNNDASGSGAAYVFVRDAQGGWSQQAYLKASNTDAGDQFGISVAASGDTIVVGASGEDSNATSVNGNQTNNSVESAGAAYVFVRTNGTWSQQAYLKASNTNANDQFGNSVAVSGDTIVVGADGEDSSATGVNGDGTNNDATPSGAAYVYVRDVQGGWSQQAYLKASNTEEFDLFGWSVAASEDTIVVGARLEDSSATGVNGDGTNNDATSSGAAYVFVRSGTAWAQQAYLKASNTDYKDVFGWSVAASGDTIVVGAMGESSSTTGVNGDQENNSAPTSGAAYVFVRSGTTWSQQAYLKASNTEVDDAFGSSVAASDDTIIVGAPYEASSATGINSNQTNNDAILSGAAYMYVRDAQGAWSQQAYLKASNTEKFDLFGSSVAASGDIILVGADGEDSTTIGINGTQSDNSASSSGAVYVFATPESHIYLPLVLKTQGQ